MKFKKNIYRALSRRGRRHDAPFAADFYGLRYEGNLKDEIEFAIFHYGAFEKPLLHFLRDALLRLRPAAAGPLCFCDVGANIGQHSLFASRYADRVHAFEPYAAVRDRMLRHIALNGLDNIQVHGVGLGDAGEWRTFYAPSGHNPGVGSFDPRSAARGNVASGRLRLERGDAFFAENGIGPAHLIKIDAEGYERKVLEGLRGTLSRQRPVVVCEVTYGEPLSFGSRADLESALPPDYAVLGFDVRRADGRVARRRGSLEKRTGRYRLLPLERWLPEGQDNLVFVPAERRGLVPLAGA